MPITGTRRVDLAHNPPRLAPSQGVMPLVAPCDGELGQAVDEEPSAMGTRIHIAAMANPRAR